MFIVIKTRDSSRPVLSYRADDVVNFYATALTLATPAAMNARDERSERVTLPCYYQQGLSSMSISNVVVTPELTLTTTGPTMQ